MGYGVNAGGQWVVTDPSGRTRTYESDPAGRITKVFDGDGVLELQNGYIGGRVTTQTVVAGATLTFAYDTAAKTTTVTNPATGETSYYQWDDLGRAASATDPDGKIVANTYDSAGNQTQSVDRRNGLVVRGFDAAGNVTSVQDQTGRLSSFEYDALHRPKKVTDGTSKVTVLTYLGTSRIPNTVTDHDGHQTVIGSEDGLITSITDPDGVTTAYGHDTLRRVDEVTAAAGTSTAATAVYEYDPAGRVKKVISPEGRITQTDYDNAGRVTKVIDGELGTTTTSYDDNGRVETVTDPAGAVTSYTYTYTATGLVKTMTDPNGVTVWEYDNENQLRTETKPGGAQTVYTYGALGRLETVTDPMGRVTEYDYDDDGNRDVEIGPDGTITTIYDEAGRVGSRSGPQGVTTYTYDDAGRPETVTTPGNQTTLTEYDNAGRVWKVTRPGGAVTTTTYTPAGRVQSVVDPAGLTTTYTYDDAGRTETVTAPGGFVTTYGYDDDGLLTSVTSPSGLVTTATYDNAGRPHTVTDPAGVLTTTTWNSRGLLETQTKTGAGTASYLYYATGKVQTVTDPNGDTTSYLYDQRPDGLGDRTKRIDALGGTETWEYNLAGQLTKEIDQLSRVTSYTYDTAGRGETDPSGRVTTIGYNTAGWIETFTHTVAGNTETTSYGYDTAGRRDSAIHNGQPWAYSYDAADRLTSITAPGNKITSWTYDPAGRHDTMVFPDGTNLAYNYNPTTGRLDTITGQGLTVAAYNYNADGQITSQTSPGAARTWAYTAGRLSGYTQDHNGSNLVTATIGYDTSGRIANETVNGAATSYSYDPADQLTNIVGRIVTPTGTINGTRDLVYDDLGRRTTDTVTNRSPITYSYNPASELIAEGDNDYLYDPAGRLTQINGPGTPGHTYNPTRPTSIFTYNAAGQLAQANYQNIGSVGTTSATSRSYDPDGNLRETNIAGAVTPIYWDPTRGTPQPHTTHNGGTVYGPGGRVATYRTDTWRPDLADHHGSTIADPANPTLTTSYGPYGEHSAFTAAAPQTGYRGELEIDGLTHLRARDYHTNTGTFTTTDPLDGINGTTVVANPYHYTNNNPLNLTDPLGLSPNDRASGTDNQWNCNTTICQLTRFAVPDDSVDGIQTGIDYTIDGAQFVGSGAFGFACGAVASATGPGAAAAAGACAESYHQFTDNIVNGRPLHEGVVPATTKGAFWGVTLFGGGKLLKPITGPIGRAIRDSRAGQAAKTQIGRIFGNNTDDALRASDDTLTDDAANLAKECLSPTGAHSFAATTPVLLADGTTKPINQIQVGDKVLATNPETGETAAREVTHTLPHTDQLVDLELEDGSTITTTEDHHFWNHTDRQWQETQHLDPGDQLLTSTGNTIAVQGLNWNTTHNAPAYDLTIADTHTYYVEAGSRSVLVHNSGQSKIFNLGDGFTGRLDTWPGSSDFEIHVFSKGKEIGVFGSEGFFAKHGHSANVEVPQGVYNRLKGIAIDRMRASGRLGPKGTDDITGDNWKRPRGC